MLLVIMLCCSIPGFAQVADSTGVNPGDFEIPVGPDGWFSDIRINWLYGVLVVVGGYLTAFIPGLKAIGPGVYRVLAWALMTGVGLALWGADIWGLAITYFMATGLYDIVLKLIFKAPVPKDRFNNELNTKIKPLIGS